MRKYRIREGSIADYGRACIVGILFWGLILGTAVSVYGL